ncbi:MAG: 1-phosphofructokinase family hexose kinase [Clostridia bacterium]|nr:1-phosphofructokinase family hexose kinase [Clostridia bacterium]
MIYTVTLCPALDRTVFVDGFALGKVNRILSERKDPGGKGINVSKTLSALGCESVAMGILGGTAGEYIVNRLEETGIAHDFVLSQKNTRTNLKVIDRQNRTTTDINESGFTDAAEAEALIEKLEKKLAPGDIVVIAGRIDTAALDIAEWIHRIVRKGARPFLDTEGEALKTGAAASPYLIKPNELELKQLTNVREDGIPALTAAAEEIRQKYGIKVLALSLGERGAVFLAEEEGYFAEALRIRAVSTVGAGDSMMACLCFGVHEGLAFEKTCTLALAASAAAVECSGTQSPEKKRIEHLLPQVKLRRIK